MWIRPRAREVIAARYPMSSLPPIRAPAATRTSVKRTSAVQAPSCPILASLAPTSTPGASAGTRKTAMPGPASSAGRVRAKTTNRSATGALVMNRFSPVITQSPSAPSRIALVRNPAGFDPAPCSVNANEATCPDASDSSQVAFCSSVPNPTGDSVCGAEHRPERQRGIAQLHRQLDILGDVEPESTPLLRDGIAEQPHVLGLVAKIVWHPVGRQNLLLTRDDGGTDELPGLGEDLLEVVVVDDRVRHESALPSSGAIAGRRAL